MQRIACDTSKDQFGSCVVFPKEWITASFHKQVMNDNYVLNTWY